ncbi:acyl-CoA dehydrogenase, partial [Streptomyces sp. SID9727]|uniref:acyl-CoA dehydrogenase n=1 Tax=Streptomyces sp. SID9727 TaxID=2706114 RepID=UPI0013CC5F63
QAAEAYAEAVEALPPGADRDRLGELARLFALGRVARDSGDLLAAGYLSTAQAEALPDHTERLIEAVAPHLPELADSFAFPAEMLADWPITGAGYADAYDDPEAHWHAEAGR